MTTDRNLASLQAPRWRPAIVFLWIAAGLVLPIEGGAAHTLPRVEAVEPQQQTYPNLSPNGHYLLYSAGTGFSLNLYRRHLESGEVVQLTNNEWEDSAACWSPDGQWIAFQREDPSGNRDIWLIRADGSGERNLTNTSDHREQHPRFMPDGRSILFDGNRESAGKVGEREDYEVYQVSLDGREPIRMTDNPHWDLYGVPSPDGKSMAWVRALPVTEKDDRDYEVFVVDLETGASRNLSDHLGYDTNPDWSPDGQWIVFASDRHASIRGRTDLFMVRPDGSDLTRLTDNGGTSMAYVRPRFAPDGSALYASRVVAGRTDTVRLRIAEPLDW